MGTEPHAVELVDLRKLTVRQQNAIDLLVTGGSDREAAEAIGASRSTVTRWRPYHPAFQAELNAQRGAIWGAAKEKLRSPAVDAVETLADLMSSPGVDDQDRIKIAVEVLKITRLGEGMQPRGPTDPEEIINKAAKADPFSCFTTANDAEVEAYEVSAQAVLNDTDEDAIWYAMDAQEEAEKEAEERRKRAGTERAERVCEGLCQIKEEEEKDKAEEARKEAERQEKEREAAAEGKKVRGRKPAGKEEKEEKAKNAKPLRRNTTDPGSRTMKTQNGYVQGYNVQIAVDRSGRVVVACDVVQDGNDKLQLRRMLAQIGESLGRPPGKLLADAGYFSAEAVEGVEGTELFVATKNRRKFGEGPVIEPGRPPTVKQAMELKLCTDEGRAVYKQRGCTVEPVNGQVKDRGGMREFRLRGTERTRTEAMLSCIGNNIKKLWKRPKDGPGRGCERPAGPVSGRSPAGPA